MKHILSIFLTVLFLTTESAFGGEVFFDDFESDTIGQPPSKWEIRYPGVRTRVVADPMGTNGSKVLWIEGGKANYATICRLGNRQSTNNATITFSICPTTWGTSENFSVKLLYNGATISFKGLDNERPCNIGLLFADGSTAMCLPEEQWYDFRMEVYWEQSRYAVYYEVDGDSWEIFEGPFSKIYNVTSDLFIVTSAWPNSVRTGLFDNIRIVEHDDPPPPPIPECWCPEVTREGDRYNLTLNGFEFEGSKYSIRLYLNQYHNPADPDGFYWKLVTNDPEPEPTPECDFIENWEAGSINVAKWQLVGDPSPTMSTSGYNGGYAVNVNGDNWCDSGLYTKDKFAVTGKLEAKFALKGYSAGTSTCMSMQAGFTGDKHQGTYCNPSTESPGYYKGIAVVYVDPQEGKRMITYQTIDGQKFEEPYPDDNWHMYRIDFRDDNRVGFYRDGIRKFITPDAVDFGCSTTRFQIRGRSCYGEMTVDDICINN